MIQNCAGHHGELSLHPDAHRPSHEDALAAALGAALVATSASRDSKLRDELLASARCILGDAERAVPFRNSAAITQLINVVGDRDSSRERIRQGAIVTFRHFSSNLPSGAQ